MQSPTQASGWTTMNVGNGMMEAPTTIERKRRGRNLDVMGFIPTPPRSREYTFLPTPVTDRQQKRSYKPSGKIQQIQQPTMLPTPQTQPRHKRDPNQAIESSNEAEFSPPSPSGHTTFMFTSSSAPRPEKVTRRRPGLTFAQQMGLISQSQAITSKVPVVGFGGRLGMGVGMGGMRPARSDKETLEENPFLDSSSWIRDDVPMGLASPGAKTRHLPRGMDVHQPSGSVSPLTSRSTFTTEVLTTPIKRKTKVTPTVPDIPMDEDNPFLVKPGESVRPRAERTNLEEQPTVTYVFRGSKKVFANPFLSSSHPFPAADLSLRDAEYEPHPNPAPRLLWPSAPSPSTSTASEESSRPLTLSSNTKKRFTRSPSFEDAQIDERPTPLFTPDIAMELDDEEMPVRRGLLFGNPTIGGKRNSTGSALGSGEHTSKKTRGLRF